MSWKLLERVPSQLKCVRFKKLSNRLTGRSDTLTPKDTQVSPHMKTLIRKKLKLKNHNDDLYKIKSKTADKINTKMDKTMNSGASKSETKKKTKKLQRQMSWAAYRF